ncbi:MAG TPA: type II toxin-antitoxin system VapC family toxin [Candidatus Saccharimonadales bacterium]|nr:type II toxin-antitoxin system VapC family toxin [Candidatus Saccharimonadales bacterium]
MGFDLLVLDTNIYTALAKNDPLIVRYIRAAEEIALPHVVIGELLGGFYYGSRFEKNEADLQKVLTKPTCRVLMPSLQTAKTYGRLYAYLKKHGTMIPTNDIWIAAITIEYEGTLATYDRDFTGIPELNLASL